ncbi:C40 family peptidase [Blastococcus jejuensis]|uniref:C40 family peptidase n=1 Tax=Blastococcus jejuensis TaxID=351224 RepID=A0ABP6NU70_9ACTN
MATATPAAPRAATRRRFALRSGFALVAAVGILVAGVPAQAAPGDPGTSAEAAELVAARGHELEVVTEQFNEARETLVAQHAAAEAAVAASNQAQAALLAAQQAVRGIARTAYTGESMSSFRALMTSESADEFVDRVATLQMVAGHQNEVLGVAATASIAAAQAQATAQEAAAQAQATYDAVAAQQADLEAQIADYQALYDRLSLAEQQAAVAAHHGDDRASRDDRSELVAATGPIVAGSQAAQVAVDTAMAQRGKPYVWAASGPRSFDCSGLTAFAYAAAGVRLPHSSRMQAGMGQSVSRAELQPGDLVFFYSPVSHVGIYIGNGQMVHAPTSGDVVKVASIDAMGGYAGARRIAG